MSDSSGFDFTKFVPGFDFLKTLTSGQGAAAPVGAGWIAPSLDPQELDKRIQELKTVHFWLDQNTKAVSATIQALEVQRMTLATLQGMNLSFAELAESLKVKPAPADDESRAAEPVGEPATAQAEPPQPSATEPAPESTAKKKRAGKSKAEAAAPAVDPAQWWGALTQQFQNIASHAMQEMSKNAEQNAASAPSEPQAATKTATGAKAGAKAGTQQAGTNAGNKAGSKVGSKTSATKKTTRRPAAGKS